jgi:hypothetical protein
MPNTTLKRWNPTLNSGAGGFEELYPKTVTSQIAASGTANSTTFLRGDGQWATPSVGSHTHTIGYYNSAITSNLDTLFGTGEFGFANTTTGRPEDYGQGINIVSSGTAHNGTDNWITQLAFGTTGSTSFFRTKVNTGAWTAWRKIWNDANDGAGSGLDADLLDGQHGSYFLDTSGSSQTKTGALTVGGNLTASNNAFAGRYYQSANGIPTGNLGSPTVTEMALFDEQFYNQTNFYDITKLKFYTSTDNVTWTEVTTISDTNKRALVGGDAGSGITIPNLTPYYRIEITNNGNYVFLNALYMYVTTSSHSMSIKIKARRRSDLTFVNITSSNNTVNLWPGHVYMPFNTIPFLTGGSSSGHYDIVHIDFQPTWSGDPTYGSFAINLHKLQVWGGYPAGKRNIYSTDENRNVTFPAALTGSRLFSTIATGTSPLSVTSTTVNTNLNADLLDGLHSSSFFRVDGTYPNTNMNTIVEGYWHVEPTAANVPIAQYGHRWDYDHLNNGQWAAQFYSATSDTDSLWFRQIRNYVAQPWQKLWSSTNDGTGSGLDADLLDGNHASAFLLTTARNAANGVAPLDATSKVPVANLPDFITGAGRGFYLVGTISGAVSLSAAGGLVSQLVGLGGGDYENMYGYMWTAAAEVTLTWTDQTTLGPVYQYHVLTPGDEGDSTSPVTLEAGDMIVFTKYSDVAGNGDDQEFTFSVINSSDPRFANYVPLTGGNITGTLNVSNTIGVGTTSPLLNSTGKFIHIHSPDTNASAIHFTNNTTGSGAAAGLIIGRWNDAVGKNFIYTYNNEPISFGTNNLERMHILGNGNVGIGTTSPAVKLHVVGGTRITGQLNVMGDAETKRVWVDFEDGNDMGTIQVVQDGVAYKNLALQPDGNNVGIGTRSPGEKLEVSGNAKATTFISTQATGTAPLTVASTTAVTNLNADLLDGNHASAFLLTSAVKEQLKYLYVYGKAQSAITKGQAVQFAGVQGDHILIKAAVPSEINTNPDYFVGLAEATLATNDFGYVLTQGELTNVNTNAYTEGAILWFASAGSTAGALTATEPTGTNAKIQVGAVTKVNATEGIILTRMHIFGVQIADIAASGTPSNSTFLRGDGAWSSVTASNVGLGNVTNESKATMFTSPAFTVTPTAPTATAGTNTTQIATTAFVSTAVANLINSAPGALDTLDELAAALGDDANFASTVTNSLALKANDNAVVKLTSDQTIAGVKTFSSDIYAPRFIANPSSGGNDTSGAWGIADYDDKLSAVRDYITDTYYPIYHTGNKPTATDVGLGNVTNESKATMFTSPTFTGTVSGVTAAMVGAAATSHTHAIADVTNLQTSLDAKLSLAGGTIDLNTGTTSRSITFNTAQSFTGPYLRGSVQNLQRGYYTDQYTIWDAGNDGAGSGLDADTVDGIQASSFALAITKYKATGTSSTSGVTTRTAVTTITLLANKYYHLDVTGMYSKTSTSGSTAPVINIAVDNTTGTPTINGRFEWLNGSAATAYTVSNTNGAITTSDSARGFTAATATLSAITTTPWGLKALFYTGTSNKILTFYISSSSAVSGTCAVDMISIRAEEVAA